MGDCRRHIPPLPVSGPGRHPRASGWVNWLMVRTGRRRARHELQPRFLTGHLIQPRQVAQAVVQIAASGSVSCLVPRQPDRSGAPDRWRFRSGQYIRLSSIGAGKGAACGPLQGSTGAQPPLQKNQNEGRRGQCREHGPQRIADGQQGQARGKRPHRRDYQQHRAKPVPDRRHQPQRRQTCRIGGSAEQLQPGPRPTPEQPEAGHRQHRKDN